jgi:hypothetical protein
MNLSQQNTPRVKNEFCEKINQRKLLYRILWLWFYDTLKDFLLFRRISLRFKKPDRNNLKESWIDSIRVPKCNNT